MTNQVTKFTEECFCDVRGWPEQLIRHAAEMMAGDLGTIVWDDSIALRVDDFDQLLGLWGCGEVFVAKTWEDLPDYLTKEVTRGEVEKMIKDRFGDVRTTKITNDSICVETAKIQNREAVMPLEETNQGLGVAHAINPITNPSAVEKLSKAAACLIAAEQDYQEAVLEAQEEYVGLFAIKPLLRLVREGFTVLPEGVEVDDPSTWQKGDIIVCTNSGECPYFTEGKEYTFRELYDGHVKVEEDDDGDGYYYIDARFSLVRRPE